MKLEGEVSSPLCVRATTPSICARAASSSCARLEGPSERFPEVNQRQRERFTHACGASRSVCLKASFEEAQGYPSSATRPASSTCRCGFEIDGITQGTQKGRFREI